MGSQLLDLALAHPWPLWSLGSDLASGSLSLPLSPSLSLSLSPPPYINTIFEKYNKIEASKFKVTPTKNPNCAPSESSVPKPGGVVCVFCHWVTATPRETQMLPLRYQRGNPGPAKLSHRCPKSLAVRSRARKGRDACQGCGRQALSKTGCSTHSGTWDTLPRPSPPPSPGPLRLCCG